jgi:hypothetical protein
MENNENICFNSTSAQSITSEVIKEKTEKNEIISDII